MQKQTEATTATIDYYDNNSDKFVSSTVDVEFSSLQKTFAAKLPAHGRILDLGCGSGRDSLAFKNLGFMVDAIDGSTEMVKAASELTGLPVVQALFDEYEPHKLYDGIWACSSLLHVPADALISLISKYAASLKLGGVFYLSFKLGTWEGMRNGRWFTDLDEEKFRALISHIPTLEIASFDITSDVRPGREDEKWLNVWCMKVDKG
jgi:SAM-dependent methyltransferase